MGYKVIANQDAARLIRIKETKWGAETAATWDTQVRQKQAEQRAQKEAELQAAKAAEHTDAAISRQLKEAWEAKVDAERRLNEFRAQNQDPTKAREWDLNRPTHERLTEDDPQSRVARGEASLGPAALQVFAGEDLAIKERQKAQEKQSSQWWAEQAAARELAKAAELDAVQQLGAQVRALDQWQAHAVAQEWQKRAEHNRHLAQANQELARQREEQKAAAKAAELRAAEAEVAANLSSPWLAESPEQARRVDSPSRVLTAEYKGMSPQQPKAIQAEQSRAAEQHKQQVKEQERQAREFALMEQVVAARVQLHQGEQAAEERARQRALLGELKSQAEEKVARDRQLSSLYSVNQVKPEYFGQFETSHR